MPTTRTNLARLLLAASLLAPACAGAATHPVRPPAASPADAADSDRIVAVVNGQLITQHDIYDRARLFALSAGLPVSSDILTRLQPQILRQLINETLRMQEILRRKIVIPAAEIAAAITDIEKRNGMPPGTLRDRLSKDGVSFQTLIDQIRVQLGWTQVLRDRLGPRAHITKAEIADEQRILKSETGQPQYEVSEIFIPIDNPAAAPEASRFADTVIQQLRAGAPFPIVAAQFSQSETALQGGDLGWVGTDQLDPAVASIVAQMPPGAVANPIRVPGGIEIVQLRGKRSIGNQMGTLLSVREAFLPFTQPLNPQAPTAQQQATLTRAKQISGSAGDCNAIAAANQAAGATRPADPGPIVLEQVANPRMRAILGGLPVGHASQPLVAQDGIAVLMVCSRDQKNLAQESAGQVADQLLQRRVELASRELQQDLRRRATIERTSNS